MLGPLTAHHLPFGFGGGRFLIHLTMSFLSLFAIYLPLLRCRADALPAPSRTRRRVPPHALHKPNRLPLLPGFSPVPLQVRHRPNGWIRSDTHQPAASRTTATTTAITARPTRPAPPGHTRPPAPASPPAAGSQGHAGRPSGPHAATARRSADPPLPTG